MAGLGGACSHIAALLFAAEAHNRLKDTSCTSQPCVWLSRNKQNVAYAPVSDINFTAPTTKRKRVLDGKSSQKSQLRKQLIVLFMSCLKQGNLHCCLSCLATVMSIVYSHSLCLLFLTQVLWICHTVIY